MHPVSATAAQQAPPLPIILYVPVCAYLIAYLWILLDFRGSPLKDHCSHIVQFTQYKRVKVRCALSREVAPVLGMGSLVFLGCVFSKDNRLDIASNGEVGDHPQPT